jgi:KDO2-lipid IV(A) lauroyltransferase
LDAATALYKGGARLARALPAPVALGVAPLVAPALTGGMGAQRRMLERHLARAVGRPLRPVERRRLVTEAFESYARYWIESFRLPSVSAAELDRNMTHEGFSHIQAAVDAGTGAILALPHLGGWDFGGAWLATRGYPVTVVVEPLQPPELFEWFAEFRRSIGLTVVPLGPEATPAVLRALKANELVGLLCDRDVGASGVEVEFFGERTSLPAGPVALALRTGAPLLPTAVYFRGRSGHHGVVRPPVPLVRAGRMRDDVAAGMQLLAGELEALIRAEPTQWHLLQPNWPSDRA